MRLVRTTFIFSLGLLLTSAVTASLDPAAAQQQEKRVALVIGNGAYAKGPLATTANDAGLVAQTLQAAGFDVIGARDLDADSLRKTFRDFMQKAESDPANTVAMVYLSGYGVQLAGENYFIPVDSTITRDTDIPIEGLRVSDYTRELASVPLKASVFVLDAARQQPFVEGGNPIASGLALVDPAPNSLIAFNAAPGTVAPGEPGPYGVYAQSLTEMIRTGGLLLPDVFDRLRLRVSENTKGGQIPWDAQKIQVPFSFFDRAPDAGHPGSGRRNPRAADARSWRARRLHRGSHARHHAGLRGFSPRLSRRSLGAAGEGDRRRAPRGDHLAPHLSRRYAGCLLVLFAALSARAACVGCPPAPYDPLGCARAAADICDDRLRPAAAAGRRVRLRRSARILFR